MQTWASRHAISSLEYPQTRSSIAQLVFSHFHSLSLSDPGQYLLVPFQIGSYLSSDRNSCEPKNLPEKPSDPQIFVFQKQGGLLLIAWASRLAPEIILPVLDLFRNPPYMGGNDSNPQARLQEWRSGNYRPGCMEKISAAWYIELVFDINLKRISLIRTFPNLCSVASTPQCSSVIGTSKNSGRRQTTELNSWPWHNLYSDFAPGPQSREEDAIVQRQIQFNAKRLFAISGLENREIDPIMNDSSLYRLKHGLIHLIQKPLARRSDKQALFL